MAERAAELESEIKEWRARWRQEHRNRDPGPADLSPDLRAKMLELRNVRAAQRGQAGQRAADENCDCANQTVAPPRQWKEAAGGQGWRQQGQAARAAAVLDSDDEQPCGRAQLSRGGEADEPDNEEEVTSDTEYASARPLLHAPAALPAAIPVTRPEAAGAGPGTALPQNSFTRALPRHAAPVTRRPMREGRPQSATPADANDGSAAAPAVPSSLPAASGAQPLAAPQTEAPSAPAAGPSKRQRLAGGPAFLGRQMLAPRPAQSQAAAECAAAPTALQQEGHAEAGPASATAAACVAALDSGRQQAAGLERQQVERGTQEPAAQGSSAATAARAVPADAAQAAGAEVETARRARAAARATAAAADMPAATSAAAAAEAPGRGRAACRKSDAGPAPLQRPAAGPSQPLPGADGAAKVGPSNVIMSRTEEGLNVVYVKRQAAPPQGSGSGGASSRTSKGGPNSGWGNNFVRYDMKKGKGSSSYKSSRHSFKKRRGGGRAGGRGWGRGASRLRQVGDGADFLEGWADTKTRCYKCGGTGHWAKDCTQHQQRPGPGELDLGESDSEGGEGPDRARELAALGLPGLHQHQHQQLGRAATGPAAHGASRGQTSFGPQAAAAAATAGGASQGGGEAATTGAAAAAAASSVSQVPQRFAATAEDPTEQALLEVLGEVFGFGAFRGLQLATIQRVLSGESVLSIMPTGMGKSLCYQLPALLLPGITLVVSPLIALMHDQRASLPQQLTSAVLWSGQTKEEALQVLADVKAGLIKVLFVSPERLGNPHLLGALQPHMPLPLVVIDEAHCVAEWGHSFRPAYFRLGWALRNSVRASRVLALTATATKATESAVLSVLGIPPSAVLRDSCVRGNLRLHVLRKAAGASSHATWDDIVALFREEGRLASVRSAIVYCAYKDDAEKLAQRLNAYGVRAAPYHAGRQLRDRAAVEADFVGGRLRVVVATVAFGMGINVRSVGAVVHATMPRSLEEYVQQVGRAGRDGGEASCFAYLSDADFVKLRALAYSGLLERETVRAFLEVLFEEGAPRVQKQQKGKVRKRKQPEEEPHSKQDAEPTAAEDEEIAPAADTAEAGCSSAVAVASELGAAEGGGTDTVDCGGGSAGLGRRRFGVLSSRQLSTQLDMREESMETVLCYLESGSNWLRVLPNTAVSVRLSFYAATAQQMAVVNPVVQVLLEECPNPRKGVYSAQLSRLATAAQRLPGLLLQELREMAAASLIAFELSREEGPAYEVLRVPGDLGSIAEELHSRLLTVLRCQVSRLDTAYRAFAAAAAEPGGQVAQEVVLRQAIAAYFEREQPRGEGLAAAGAELQQQDQGEGKQEERAADGTTGGTAATGSGVSGWDGSTLVSLDLAGLPLRPATPELLHAARAVLRRNAEQAGPALAPLMLARVLAGLSSPAYPAKAACKMFGSFWGSHSGSDFGVVLRAAEIAVRDAGA